MKELVFTLKDVVRLPVDGFLISPDVVSSKTIREIQDMSILVGSREQKLSTLFKLTGDTSSTVSDQAVLVNGNVDSFRGIGKEMSGGTITVNGDAGPMLGEGMKAGTILIRGNVRLGAGSSMQGGLIQIDGSAEGQLGSSYRGKGQGMSGGTIVVNGGAGYEVGAYMTGGFINVKGDIGQFTGTHMKGGEILIEGASGERLGAEMTGGKIVLLGRIPEILPSFTFEEIRNRATAADRSFRASFYLFRGDVNENGNGRLFVSVDANPQLKFYEKYL